MQARNRWLGLALGLLLFALCFGYLKYGPRSYTASRSVLPGEVYWTDTDLFITANSSSFAHSQLKGASDVPFLNLLVTMVAGNETAFTPAQLTVYHYSGDAIQRDDIEARSVTPVPYEKSLYFVQTSVRNEPERVWRWDGLQLATMPKEQAKAVIEHSQAALSEDEDTEYKVPEGWHRASLMSAANKTLTIPLRSAAVAVRTSSVNVPYGRASFPATQVTVEAPSLPTPVPLFETATMGMHAITREQFEAMQAKNPSRRTHVSPWSAAYYLSEYLVFLLLFTLPFWVSIINLVRIKSKLMANLPEDASFPNATPSQFTALDTAYLEQATRQLEALGFETLLDFTMVSSMAMRIPGFARLMVNRSHNCYAEINQVFPPRKKPVQMAISFATYFSDGWRFSTGSRAPNGGNWIMRLPRAPWISKPGLDAYALFHIHEQRCAALRNDLALTVLPATDAETHFRGMAAGLRERREVVKKKWLPVILFEFYAFKFRKRSEWRGEWSKIVANRTGQPAMVFTEQ